MSKIYHVLLTIITLMLFNIPSHAEVYLKENRLTMNVQGVPVQEVLDALTQQTQIKIVALEETYFGNVKISKRFWGLPLEEGLHRVLSGWNYGITRDTATGKIRTLYLASRRKDSSTPVRPPADLIPHRSNQHFSRARTQPTVLSHTHEINNLEPTHEPKLELEEDFLNDEELEVLPPNFIETLERWERKGNG